MRNYIYLFLFVIFASINSHAQNDRISSDFDLVRSELTQWDPIRGEWLASSFMAMSLNEPIPDRTFPEKLTPSEMYSLVPLVRRLKIEGFISTGIRNASLTNMAGNWTRLLRFSTFSNGQILTASSLGDPHLISFDGEATSFQAVGEFVLCKSELSNFEIQNRQESQPNSSGSPEVSFNTAVALSVAGDKVCIYANEKPDNTSNSSLRVNGEGVILTNSTYYLPHGGIISYSNKSYTVSWPSGEKGVFQMKNIAEMNYINITVQIYSDSLSDYSGMLGNANGTGEDDFGKDLRNNSVVSPSKNLFEKPFLSYMVKDFGNGFRVSAENTLFIYKKGESTLTYTDLRYPKKYITIGDLSDEKRSAAEKNCTDNGVSGLYLNGCIYDNAYLDIFPSAKPDFIDPTRNLKLVQLDRPIENINATVGNINGTRENNADTIIPDTKTPPKESFARKINRFFTTINFMQINGSGISMPSPNIILSGGSIFRP